MTPRPFEKVRYIIENTPGLTQRGLAQHMGINASAVNRLFHDKRNILADEIPVIESYLGVRLDQYVMPASHAPLRAADFTASRRGFSDIAATALCPATQAEREADTLIPVYAHRRGGDIAGWVARHPLQNGIPDAYALYIRSDEMQPRYFPGETVYVHPARPPGLKHDCVVETHSGEVLVRQLAGQTGARVTLRQFDPDTTQDIALRDIKSLSAIVGRN